MSGLTIARIYGFEIRLHLSWVLVLAIVALLAAVQSQAIDPNLPDAAAWVVGGVAAAGFLVSVLVHELAHATVARRRGIVGGPISLFFFGGSASLELESTRASDEIAIASSGLLVSAAIGGVLALIAWLMITLTPSDPGVVLSVVAICTLTLGTLNLLLAVVNVLPAPPLDGGRILRGAIWLRTGDERRGTKGTATIGRLLGWGLFIVGLLIILAGGPVDAVMLIIVGWLVTNSARTLERRMAMEDLLEGVRVDEAMERDLPSVAPQLTVDVFADQLGGAGGAGLAIVRDRDWLGLVGPSQLRRLGRRTWANTRAGEVMIRAAELPTLHPTDTLWMALETLRRTGLDGLPVIGSGRDDDAETPSPSETAGDAAEDTLLGVLTRRSVMKAITARAQARVSGSA